MKTVFHIAYAELRMLFYSPIAWLLLCLFTFQSGMAFVMRWAGCWKPGKWEWNTSSFRLIF